MATMHSRCYFSITIHGTDAVTVIHSSQHLVSFGGPKVQHSCAMNTWCIQYSFHNYMLVPVKGWNSGYINGTLCLCQRRGGNLAIFMALCVCAREGVEIWLYSWHSVFVPEKGWKSMYYWLDLNHGKK